MCCVVTHHQFPSEHSALTRVTPQKANSVLPATTASHLLPEEVVAGVLLAWTRGQALGTHADTHPLHGSPWSIRLPVGADSLGFNQKLQLPMLAGMSK